MKEEKKVSNKKTSTKTTTTKKSTGAKKTTTAKKTTVTKKATPAKKTTTTKKTSTTKASKVNLEPKEIKVQKNVEFPEDRYTKKVDDTTIFTKTEKDNIKEVVDELKYEKDLKPSEKKLIRSTYRKNAITIIGILMVAIALLTVGYVFSEQKKIQKQKNVETSQTKTLNSNIYDKIVQNTKDRDKNLEETKPSDDDKKDKPEVTEVDYSNITTISLEEFESKVLLHENITVIISSSTCYYCLTYEPIVNEELNNQDKTIYRLNIFAMDADDIKTLKGYYSFIKTPTLFHVNDQGIVDDELVGSRGIEEVSEWLKNK